jgi:15-cis-phytoene synthase
MTIPIPDSLTAPQTLALQYVPPQFRAALELLLAFDHRLALVVRQMSEPVIAQMRMAWWREKLALSGDLRPSGEPIFAALEQLPPEQTIPVEQGMLLIIDAWDAVIAAAVWDHDVIMLNAQNRARGIFLGLAKQILPAREHSDVMDVGCRWALSDLQMRFPEHVAGPLPPTQRLPRQLRSLAILERAISLDLQHKKDGQSAGIRAWFRLLVCAMTGR